MADMAPRPIGLCTVSPSDWHAVNRSCAAPRSTETLVFVFGCMFLICLLLTMCLSQTIPRVDATPTPSLGAFQYQKTWLPPRRIIREPRVCISVLPSGGVYSLSYMRVRRGRAGRRYAGRLNEERGMRSAPRRNVHLRASIS